MEPGTREAQTINDVNDFPSTPTLSKSLYKAGGRECATVGAQDKDMYTLSCSLTTHVFVMWTEDMHTVQVSILSSLGAGKRAYTGHSRHSHVTENLLQSHKDNTRRM